MIKYYSIFDQEDEQTMPVCVPSGAVLMDERTNSTEINRRRQRVNRIKRGIVYTVLGTIMFLAVFSAILCVLLVLNGRKLNILQEKIVEYTELTVSMQDEIQSLSSEVERLEGEIADLREQQKKEIVPDEPADEEVTAEAPQVKEYDVKDHIGYSENVRSDGEPMKVYLTFDDGPSSNTEKILDLLDKHGVKGTFFVNGKEEESLLPLYKEITDRGNTIGMHSYSHDYNTVYDSVEGFETDMLKLRDLIYEQTGVEPVYYRFPGGSSNTVSRIGIDQCVDVLSEYQIVYFDWNVQCGDATTASLSVDTLVNNVMRDVVKYKTSVVLMHDAAGRDKTVKALGIILDKLEAMDAEILPITAETDVIHHE